MYAVKSELGLFDPPPINASITGNQLVKYNPITPLDSSNDSIEFLMNRNPTHYKQLDSIYLSLSFKITPTPVQDLVAETVDRSRRTTNNLTSVIRPYLHSIFKSVQVYFNQVLVSSIDKYNLSAYLLTVLSYNKNAQDSYLEVNGFTDLAIKEIDKDSDLSKGKVINCKGRLLVDVFSQQRYLIPGVEIRINLSKDIPDFYMFEHKSGAKHDISILDCSLYCREYSVNPGILASHQKLLAAGVTAKYAYSRYSLKHFNIPSGVNNISSDVVNGVIPNMLILCFCPNANFTGTFTTSPFIFENFGMNQITIFVNNTVVASHKYSWDANGGIQTSEGYSSFCDSIGNFYSNTSNMITKDLFDTTQFIQVFNLSNDFSTSSSSDCISPIRSGTVRAEITFSDALTTSLSMIVMTTNDTMLEIDALRNVTRTY